MIHIYQIINGAGLICSLILGIYILLIRQKDNLNLLFFIKCSTISLFILVATLTEFADNEHVVILYKLTMSVGALLVVFIFQFYIELTATGINKFIRTAFYLLAIAVITAIIKADPVVYSYNRYGYFWKFVPAYGELWFYCWVIYLLSCFSISVYLLFRWSIKTESVKEKIQSHILICSITITLIIIIITDILLPKYDFFIMPYLSTISLTFYVSALYFTLIRYRFLTFNISDITGNIISNIQEMVLVVDTGLRIITANNSLLALLPDTTKDIKGYHLFEVITKTDFLNKQIALLLKGSERSFKCRVYYKHADEPVITDSYISRITDKFSDLTGLLIISIENKGEKHFRIAYKLTDREFEILNLCITGFSNREISEKLSIRERTVESHVANVYNKLGVNNRIELMNIAYDFNLIQKNTV